MGASRLVIASIVFFLLVAGVWAEEAAIGDGIAEPEPSDSALKRELELLRSKIQDLGQSGMDLGSFPYRAVDPVLGRALFQLCIPVAFLLCFLSTTLLIIINQNTNFLS